MHFIVYICVCLCHVFWECGNVVKVWAWDCVCVFECGWVYICSVAWKFE